MEAYKYIAICGANGKLKMLISNEDADVVYFDEEFDVYFFDNQGEIAIEDEDFKKYIRVKQTLIPN